MLRTKELEDELYILFEFDSDISGTYNIGGGSSTPSKPRVFDNLETAIKTRDRYWPKAKILIYVLDTNQGIGIDDE